jgi:hypothetical protein
VIRTAEFINASGWGSVLSRKLAQLAQEIGANLAPIFKLNVDLGPLRQFLSSLRW